MLGEIAKVVVGGILFEVVKEKFFPEKGQQGQQGQNQGLSPNVQAQGGAHVGAPQRSLAQGHDPVAHARFHQAQEAEQQAAAQRAAMRQAVPLDRHIPAEIAEEVYQALEAAPPETLDILALNALRAGFPVAAMHLSQCAVQVRQDMVPAPTLHGPQFQNVDPEQDALNKKHAGLIARQVELNKLPAEERRRIAEDERQKNLAAVAAVLEEQMAVNPSDPTLARGKDLITSAVMAAQEKAAPKFEDRAQDEHDYNQVIEHAKQNGANGAVISMEPNPVRHASNGEVAG